MIINNLDLRIFDFVNVFLVSHFYHEPPARETGQPLPVYMTVNKLYLIPYTSKLVTVFLELRSWKAVRLSEKIMSTDKYPIISVPFQLSEVHCFYICENLINRTLDIWQIRKPLSYCFQYFSERIPGYRVRFSPHKFGSFFIYAYSSYCCFT